MPNLPKPMSRQKLMRSLESYESKSDEILPISQEFERHCEAVWDVRELSQKELVTLYESLSKKTGKNSVLLVHLSN
jgi:hypothetical protein